MDVATIDQLTTRGSPSHFVNMRSQSAELHYNIQHSSAAVEKQEDKADSYAVD